MATNCAFDSVLDDNVKAGAASGATVVVVVPVVGATVVVVVGATVVAVVGASVVAVVGATVSVVVGATVVPVVGATVVVVSVFGATIGAVTGATDFARVRVIVFFAVLATYLPDLAIFKVNVHEPVLPIVSVVGFPDGVTVHKPLLDQVFFPGEFVETRADKLVF